MFRFADPIYLLFLTAIPVAYCLRLLLDIRRKKRLNKTIDPALQPLLMPNASRIRPKVKFWLMMACYAFAVIMLARPQFGTAVKEEKRMGIETIIAMDISNSMLSDDVQPNRLQRSKMMVEGLIDHFSNDRMGLIVFAGDAFVQLPITSDFVSAKMFLSDINPSLIKSQGTDIARAIDIAINSFTQQEKVGKAIIVITDGEDHEGGAIEAARNAKEHGMRVYVLGVGSREGGKIPLGNGQYMIDNTGADVITVLNEEMCKQVAEAGGGAYIHVDNSSSAKEQLDNELNKLAKTEISATQYSDFAEQYQWAGILAIILLIMYICILERKTRLSKHFSIFKRKKKDTGFLATRAAKASLVAILLITNSSFLISASAQTDRQHIKSGNKNYRNGNVAQAETDYLKSLEKNKENTQAIYNLGNAYMMQHKDSLALEQFKLAAQKEKSPQRKAMAYHNMGVVLQQYHKFGEAMEAYKQCMRLTPGDDEARYNYELCRRQKKDEQQQQNQQDQQQDQNGENEKKEEQQKQDQQQQQQDQQKQEQQQQDRQNAEQMLKAAMQQEKQTQKKLKEKETQKGQRTTQRNW